MFSYTLWRYFTSLTILVGTRIAVEEERPIHQCQVHETIMHCTGVVPDDVPDTIRGVEISDVEEEAMSRLGAWSHIESLSIECPRSKNKDSILQYTLPNGVFEEFTNLTYLRISCKNLEDISDDAFYGLVNVKVLDLTDCVSLSSDRLPAAMKDNLPSLEKLILRRISLFVTTSLVFSLDFFQSLRNKRLTHLDLSETKNGSFHMKGFAESLPYLRSFNVSEGGFLAINLALCFYFYGKQLQTIREVDVSYPTFTDTVYNPANRYNWLPKFPPDERFVQNLTTIFARGHTPRGARTRIYGVDLGFRLCIQIRILPQHISITAFCLVKNEYGIPLQRLSMAYNGIEDVDESLTSVATDLRYVDLSHNRLFLMEPDRLENALKHASKLTEFHASNNLISSLPYWIFNNTLYLEVIDLSHNNIFSIDFKINHLRFLRILKLNNNKIHTLNAGERVQLQDLIGGICSPEEGKQSIRSCPHIRMDISSNPLDCSCDNREFFEWIRDVKAIYYQTFCEIDSTQSAKDRQILSKLDIQCFRTVIIATSCGAAGFLVILAIVIGVVCIRRKRIQRRKKHIMELIGKYRTVDNTEKYPVFLSYSSVDDEFIHTHVVEEMNKRLQGLLNTDKTCVATGDATFRPGFYIADEIIKLVELSEVVVLCVSKSFCKSPWCKDEIIVSQYQRKPMVLMFLEEVKSSDMPKVLRTFFNKYARSKWINDDDGVKLIPDWQSVCQSIVDLISTEADTTTYL